MRIERTARTVLLGAILALAPAAAFPAWGAPDSPTPAGSSTSGGADLKGVDLHRLLELSDISRGGGPLPGIEWTSIVQAFDGGKLDVEREFIVSGRAVNGKLEALVEFLTPPRTKGQKLLVVDRTMWFSTPDARKPVPISARQRLSGPAAAADVIASNYVEDYKVTSIREEVFEGKPCYVLDLLAKDDLVTYRRLVYWVEKKQLLGLRADYYSVSNKLMKMARFEYGHSIEVDGQQRPFLSKVRIQDAIKPDIVSEISVKTATRKLHSPAKFNLSLLSH
jgi:hypothetical protein